MKKLKINETSSYQTWVMGHMELYPNSNLKPIKDMLITPRVTKGHDASDAVKYLNKGWYYGVATIANPNHSKVDDVLEYLRKQPELNLDGSMGYQLNVHFDDEDIEVVVQGDEVMVIEDIKVAYALDSKVIKKMDATTAQLLVDEYLKANNHDGAMCLGVSFPNINKKFEMGTKAQVAPIKYLEEEGFLEN